MDHGPRIIINYLTARADKRERKLSYSPAVKPLTLGSRAPDRPPRTVRPVPSGPPTAAIAAACALRTGAAPQRQEQPNDCNRVARRRRINPPSSEPKPLVIRADPRSPPEVSIRLPKKRACVLSPYWMSNQRAREEACQAGVVVLCLCRCPCPYQHPCPCQATVGQHQPQCGSS
eukprot:1747291-Prymnesium_polylepis.2